MDLLNQSPSSSQNSFTRYSDDRLVPILPATEIPDPGLLPDPELETVVQQPVPNEWKTVTVKSGENLSVIFDRLHLSPIVLHQVMTSGAATKTLKRLIPGVQLEFLIRQGELLALRYEQNLNTTLHVTKEGDAYHSKTEIAELDSRLKVADGVIKASLYQAALDAGLSDNMIMRLVGIYSWDIDFALDIRVGDSFKIIYEEIFKHGKKVGEGSILVTEFTNRGNIHRAVLYTSPDGETGHYNENGYSMRKAFLRTPLKFNRISSGFDLRRKHPVLNRIRAHRGVDYAAPTGTPVKATGDGIVASIGKNGGYGNMIELRHGGIYNTVYAHLSSFVKGLKRGQHVKQGDVIGYVGMTGLATGPHLHYEFRVHGVHQNPLTVKLPKALKIPDQQMAHFHEQTRPLLARLERNEKTDFAANDIPGSDTIKLALIESNEPDHPLR